MPLKPHKRRFLVAVLGEERTEALLARLPVMERALEEAGIGWKDVGDGLPLGGATSWEAVDAFGQGMEVLEMADTFSIIISNVMASDMSTEEKASLVSQAADDLEDRLGQVSIGEKAALYVEDLLGTSGTKSSDKESAEAIKQLREGGGPAAGLTADLLEVGPIR